MLRSNSFSCISLELQVIWLAKWSIVYCVNCTSTFHNLYSYPSLNDSQDCELEDIYAYSGSSAYKVLFKAKWSEFTCD